MMPPRDPRAFDREVRRYRRNGRTYGLPEWDIHVYDHNPVVDGDTYELPSDMHRKNAMLDRNNVQIRADYQRKQRGG